MGVGFSYGALKVETSSEEAAADIWTFIQIFLSDIRFVKYSIAPESSLSGQSRKYLHVQL